MDPITFATGLTITIPGLLGASWTILKSAYDLYGRVEMRKSQIRVLLDRCSDIVMKIAEYLHNSNAALSPRIENEVKNLEQICGTVEAVMNKLMRKGFLWCMVHQDKIDTEIALVKDRITDAFAVFDFIAHVNNDEFRQELRRAREQDRAELNAKLDSLLHSEQQTMRALQDQGERVEELLVDVLKCIRELGPDQTPEARFLRNAGAVLQRMSRGRGPDISEDWIISSLEVEFEPSDVVGQGSFGRVFKARWNGARVAVKQMYVDDARTLSQADRKMMYKEVRLWSTLHHPYVVQLYGACLESSCPFLMMQYCGFGNLYGYLADRPNAPRVDMVYDIAAGVAYLHGKNIVHADLKCANILVDDTHHALVADFGLSTIISGIRTRTSPSVQNTSSLHAHGTLQWMAPECLDGNLPTKASDIYSLAITIWEIFSGKIPFEGINDRVLGRLVVDQERRPTRPERLKYDLLWKLVLECWAPLPASRPTIQNVQASLTPLTTRLENILNRGPAQAMSLLPVPLVPSDRLTVPNLHAPPPPDGLATASTQSVQTPLSDSNFDDELAYPPSPREGFHRPALNINIDYVEHDDPPIVWDMRFAPSTHANFFRFKPRLCGVIRAIPMGSLTMTDLSSYATDPPVAAMRLYHPRLPWFIDVFAIDPHSVMLQHLLNTLWLFLRERTTRDDLDFVTTSERAEITKSFKVRCSANDEELQGGIRRVDFLRGSYTFLGLSQGRGGMWEMQTRCDHTPTSG